MMEGGGELRKQSWIRGEMTSSAQVDALVGLGASILPQSKWRWQSVSAYIRWYMGDVVVGAFRNYLLNLLYFC